MVSRFGAGLILKNAGAPEIAEIKVVRRQPMAGVNVFTNDALPITEVVSEFPKDRFFEYEESDRAWMEGLGLMVRAERPVVYQIGAEFHMHPDALQMLIGLAKGGA